MKQDLSNLTTVFVTPDYVAAFLHVDRRTVCNWLASGRLRGTRPGGRRWLIAQSDLMAYIEANSNEARPSDPSPAPPDPAGQSLSLENVTKPEDSIPPIPPPAPSPLANRKSKRGSARD